MQKKRNEIIQSVMTSNENQDIVFQFEKVLLLLGNPEILGLLLSLLFLNQIGFVQFKTQKQLAEVLGFSQPTFIKKRRLLESLGLLEVLSKGHIRIIKLKFLTRLSNFELPKDTTKQIEYMARQTFSLTLEKTENGQLKLEELKNFKSSSIYIYNRHLKSVNTNNNNSKSISSKSISKLSKLYNAQLKKIGLKKTFPRENYIFVLNAFKKCKGVGLFGPEEAQHYRAIKTMFKAGRTPKQIVAFMKWMRDHEDDERTPWVKTWTIWTIQKKMPEFLGGKLAVKKTEEAFPRYD